MRCIWLSAHVEVAMLRSSTDVPDLPVDAQVHMFVDTLNAPPDAIGGTVLRVAEQLGANIIVTTSDCYVRCSPVGDRPRFWYSVVQK